MVIQGQQLDPAAFRLALIGPAPFGAQRIDLDILDRQPDRLVVGLAEGLYVGNYDVVLETCSGDVVLEDGYATPIPVPQFQEPAQSITLQGEAFGTSEGTLAVGEPGNELPANVTLWQDDRIRFELADSYTENGPQTLVIDSGNRNLRLLDAVVITGIDDSNDDRPGLVSAVATSNTTILAQFSEPIIGGPAGAGNPALYRITAPAGFPTVIVLSAQVLPPDYDKVLLTTMSQSDLVYTLEVSGIEDLAGNPLAEPDILVDPTRTDFSGIPPSGSEIIDSDGDGLSDAAEQRGWAVMVRLLNGSTSSSRVTSDPGDPRLPIDDPVNVSARDTDGDGLNDFDEKNFGTNPRSGDTDADSLGDNAELNEIYSDPSDQDTDGDSYADGLEFEFFGTSPILDDSDGDQLTDDVEIALGNRNPLVADLPQPTLEVGEINLQLDVRFVESTSQSTQVIDSKSVNSSLVQSDSREISNASSETQEAFAKLSASTDFTISGRLMNPGVEATVSVGAEAGWTGSWTTENTETSSAQTQRAYEESLNTEASASEGASVSREIEGASVQAALLLKTTGTLGYRLQNLQVTALKQDRFDPSRLVPIATLLPDAEPGDGYVLGPLSQQVGPIILSSQTVFPSQVEDLMRNPRGLVFQISNFDIIDEFGRNFVFTSQDIVERTTNLVIDRGSIDEDGDGIGDLTEYNRVSTGFGRVIDTNGDSIIDDNDRRVVFDSNGQHVGITLAAALEAAGYQQYDEDQVPSDTLSEEELERSFSVRSEGPNGNIERIYRIGRTSEESGLPKSWEVITATGIDSTTSFEEYTLATGEDLKLAFDEDLDFDRLTSRTEFMNNCSDQCVYSDDPNDNCDYDPAQIRLDDRFEVLVGWEVDVDAGSYRVFSSCRSLDSDGDGLTDLEEAPGIFTFETQNDPSAPLLIAGAEQDLTLTAGPPLDLPLDFVTDPNNPDTDGDGVSDFEEINGFSITLFGTTTPQVFRTNPNRADSDGDGASDGIEREFGGDPTISDVQNFSDRDGDGLVTIIELQGWPVEIELPSEIPVGASAPGVCSSRCEPGAISIFDVRSDPDVADTDFDGLLDSEERALGTHPGLDSTGAAAECSTPPAPPIPCGKDTDGDGLTDFEEVNGFMVDGEVIYTDPLDADSDDDKRWDGLEAELNITEPGWWVIRVLGQEAYRVTSHPLIADVDFDTLVDGDEFIAGSDPSLVNTDQDSRDDAQEVERGTDPAAEDYNVSFAFREIEVIEDCDTTGTTFSNSGDFQIVLGVVRPNGDSLPRLVTPGSTFLDPSLAVVPACTGLDLAGVPPFYPENTLWQGPCRRQDDGSLMIPDPSQAPPAGARPQYSRALFDTALSTAEFGVNVQQSFRPFGSVNEWDREFGVDWDTTSAEPVDPTARDGQYPYFIDDPFAVDLEINGEEATSKTFFGSDLEPGSYTLVYTKPSPCSIKIKALMIVD